MGKVEARLGEGGDWGLDWENAMGASQAMGEGGCGLEVSGVCVLDDWGSAVDLDDVLSLDWVGVWDSVWLGHVDWSGHLDDVLDVLGHIVWHGVWLLNMDRLLDDVGFLLNGDNGRVDLLGALQGSWHLDGNVRDGWLDDFSVEAGNVSLLAIVDLLADLLWGLGDGNSVGTHDLAGGVGSWQADGSWGWGSNVSVSSESSTNQGWASKSQVWGSNQLSWGGGGSGDDSREDSGHWVHDEECLAFLSEDKGVCN